jgi:hypothetical protein
MQHPRDQRLLTALIGSRSGDPIRGSINGVLGQASRAFSSMSIVAPNCCQRAVLHKGSICTPPSVMLILVSRVCLLVSMSILEFHFSPSIEVSVFCECRNEEHTAAFSHTRACDLTLLLTKRDQDIGFLCIICTFRSPQLRKSRYESEKRSFIRQATQYYMQSAE